MKKLVFLTDIDIDQSPHVRFDVRDDVVAEYAERYKERQPMPPVDVFKVPGIKPYLLADGLHRTKAQLMLNRKGIEAEIHTGTMDDCIAFALLANSKHGLRRSNADKHHCAKLALKQWPDKSDRTLAAMAGVSHPYIATVRSEMVTQKAIAEISQREGADGKTYPPSKPQVVANQGSDPNQVVTVTTCQGKPKPGKFPPKKGEVMDLDSVGYPIPKALLPLWNRTEEVQEILSTLSNIMGFLKKAQASEDVMYAEVNFSAAIGDLDKAWTSIQTAKPYAVCTLCQGHPETQEKGCRMCRGKGLISKYRWDRLATEEVKKLRMKAVKK